VETINIGQGKYMSSSGDIIVGKPAPSSSLTRRRGRPKIERPSIDTGTPELVMKRLMGLTAESLDLCLERGIINPEQHWCGIHLRWLYTLRHGAPGVRALDPTHLGGFENKLDNSLWRQEREREYLDALARLHESKHAVHIMNICVFNERLKFLDLKVEITTQAYKEIETSINNLRSGLDILISLWK